MSSEILPAIAVAVSGGWEHSLALGNDGTVVTWGNNTFNQTSLPGRVNNVTRIAGGYHHCLALKADSSKVPWGLTLMAKPAFRERATKIFVLGICPFFCFYICV